MARQAKPSVDQVDNSLLTAMQERFCAEYLIDMNGKAAAIRAGYAESGSGDYASRALRKPAVQKRLAELQAARALRVQMSSDDVLKLLMRIAKTDIRRLTGYHHGPCRYCHGIEGRFQWRTPREWAEACVESTKKDNKEPPSNAGGYGYNMRLKPREDCPECNGIGIGYTRFADTDTLTEDEAMVFQGVKETRDGLQYVILDRSKAIDRLADHFGLTIPKDPSAANAFIGMVDQLLRNQGGSKPPLRSDAEPVPTPPPPPQGQK